MYYQIKKGEVLRTHIIVISLIFSFILAACSLANPENIEVPQGDAARGEALFSESIKGAPACSSCHHISIETLVGPGLVGIGERAASRVDGQSASAYIYLSMIQPANHIVSGFSNLMYAGYQSKLSQQELADLLAYLLTL
jgi:cytochrome c2